MDSPSLERSLVSIRICLVIGLRLRLRMRLDWTGLTCCRDSGEFVRFDLYTLSTIYPLRVRIGEVQ